MTGKQEAESITYHWNLCVGEDSPIHETFNGDDGARLILEARRAREFAYAPYSRFSVGAAVRMDDGVGERVFPIYRGCNVENASYGATVCAERNAIFSAVAYGGKRIRAIAISLDTSHLPDLSFRAPCGVCRQVISEFADESTAILIDSGEIGSSDLTGDVFGIDDLLPHRFRLLQDTGEEE